MSMTIRVGDTSEGNGWLGYNIDERGIR